MFLYELDCLDLYSSAELTAKISNNRFVRSNTLRVTLQIEAHIFGALPIVRCSPVDSIYPHVGVAHVAPEKR
jgi:hypothetical protein